MSRPSAPALVERSYTCGVESFGTRLRSARESVGLTQDDVAEELGVTKGSVSAWEKDRNFPQLETFTKLCQIYRSSADFLISGIPPRRLDHWSPRISDDQAGYPSQPEILDLFDRLSPLKQEALLSFLRD